MQDRFRGQMAYGAVSSKQLDHLSSSPMATPTIGAVTELSTGANVNRFFTVITMNREAFGDTDGAVLATRATLLYHLEDTAGDLIDGAAVTAADNGNTSGVTLGTVLPSSTAGGFHHGTIICSSTGEVSLSLATSSGDGSTFRMFLTLPSGLVVAGSTLVFTT